MHFVFSLWMKHFSTRNLQNKMFIIFGRLFLIFVRDVHSAHKTQIAEIIFNLSPVHRGFPKVDHSGINTRIALEQINSAKQNCL